MIKLIFTKRLILLTAFILIAFSFGTHHALAANKYWVGGGSSTNWGATGPTNWSTTSGGVNNAAVPTSSDDVFFNASSGSGTTVVEASKTVRSIDFTGFTGTFNQSGVQLMLSLSDNNSVLKFSSGMNYVINSSSILRVETTSCAIASCTTSITTSGKTMPRIDFFAHVFISNAILSLQDDLNSSGGISFVTDSGGILNTNNYNISSSYAFWGVPNQSITTINLGSSTWTLTGSDSTAPSGKVWYLDADGVDTIFNAGTSTLKFTDSTSNSKTIYSGLGVGNINYYNVWFSGTGTGVFNMLGYGSYTVNDFKIDNPPHTLNFDNLSSLIVNSFTVSGTSGNLITLDSDDGSTSFTISKSSGTVSVDYLDISNSTATGGATWYAGANSIDGGGNTGWIFAPTMTVQPATSISTSSATLNGTITATGGENATSRGFNYGIDTSYGTTTTESGSFSAGAYTASITGLTCNTTYHFRAYATNGSGTHYSSDEVFTIPCPSQGRPPAPSSSPAPSIVAPAVVTPTLVDTVNTSSAVVSNTTQTVSPASSIQAQTQTINTVLRQTPVLIKSDAVNILQTYLNINNYGNLKVDGFFGNKTKQAVVNFQKSNGLNPDGVVGPLTLATINAQ